ncbi:MAG: hypothetical protein ACTSRG_26610 [Candidatus Helarchaeota archaeon]
MKEIIFVGGTKGVGKTSLISKALEKFDLGYINTGERVREYRPFFEEKLVRELKSKQEDILLDTHYAVSSRKTPYEFMRGLSEETIFQIRIIYSKRKVLLLTSTPEEILYRRKRDGNPKRIFDLNQITLEEELNKKYSKEYSDILGCPLHIIENRDGEQEKAVKEMIEILSDFI